MRKNNLLHIEVIRIIAIILVIYNHTGDRGSTLYTQYQSTEIAYWFWSFWAHYCKINVPLFFMIAGALLLGKDEKISRILSHRVLKIIKALFFISIAYYLLVTRAIEGGDVYHFIKLFYSGWISPFFWFLYAYIVFLILLPFTRGMSKVMDISNFKLLISVYIIAQVIIPLLSLLLFDNKIGMTEYLAKPWILSKLIIFPLLGYYVEKNMDFSKITLKHILLFLSIIIICTVFNTYLTYYSEKLFEINKTVYYGPFGDTLYRNMFDVANALLTYIIIKYFISYKDCFKGMEKLKKIISIVGSCVFGIYLVHAIVMICILHKFGFLEFLNQLNSRTLGACVYVLASFMLSLLVVLILKKLKIFNSIL